MALCLSNSSDFTIHPRCQSLPSHWSPPGLLNYQSYQRHLVALFRKRKRPPQNVLLPQARNNLLQRVLLLRNHNNLSLLRNHNSRSRSARLLQICSIPLRSVLLLRNQSNFLQIVLLHQIYINSQHLLFLQTYNSLSQSRLPPRTYSNLPQRVLW